MTKQEKIDFLRELKAEINENTTFSCTYPIDERIDYFIWVKTKDAKIGNLDCHYEVIFYSRGDGVRTDVPFVEVHFENPETFENFHGIDLPEGLEYADWEGRKDSRIVYTDEGKNFSKEAIIERLKKLERLIGQDLRDAFARQIPKTKKKTVQREPEYPRNPAVIENALCYAGNKCEIDNTHTSFIADDGENYMEGHHLIPLSKQGDFETSLDQEQNVVCLCPNCHKEIHHGKDRLKLVTELWNKRKTDLKAADIGINLSDLKAYYS